MNVADARFCDGGTINETKETTNALGIENSAAVLLPKGTVCLSRTGSIGYSVIMGRPMATSQGYVNWICGDEILPRFLQLIFQAERPFLHEISEGVAHTTIYFPECKAFHVCIPKTAEQRRIVAEIEKQLTRLEAGVAALRRVQANLKRYRAAVLKAACEGKLVPTEAELTAKNTKSTKKNSGSVSASSAISAVKNSGYETGAELLARILTERRQNWQSRGKYKEPAAPDTANLPSLTDGWTWLSIEAIGFVTKLAGFEYTKYVKYSPDGDLAVIKAENAGRSGFKRTEISRIKSSTVAKLTRSQLKAGDLLMVFVGAGTGNVARVPDDQPYFLGPNIAMIRVYPNFVSEAYLEIFLRSPVGHSLTFGFIKAVAQPSLSMGTIRMIPVALPPLAEQARIVAEVERRLSVVEELESVVSANLQRAVRLRQSILQKAFTGQL
jgi:type I restriction enzyme S subunit